MRYGHVWLDAAAFSLCLPHYNELSKGSEQLDSSFIHKLKKQLKPWGRKWDRETAKGYHGMAVFFHLMGPAQAGRAVASSFLPFHFFSFQKSGMSHPKVNWLCSSFYIPRCQGKSACNCTHPQGSDETQVTEYTATYAIGDIESNLLQGAQAALCQTGKANTDFTWAI